MTNPVEEFSGLMAFIYTKAGADGLKEVLEVILTERPNTTYELMADAVDGTGINQIINGPRKTRFGRCSKEHVRPEILIWRPP
jgi:hypothetical protein